MWTTVKEKKLERMGDKVSNKGNEHCSYSPSDFNLDKDLIWRRADGNLLESFGV